jgi:hypothetical protein
MVKGPMEIISRKICIFNITLVSKAGIEKAIFYMTEDKREEINLKDRQAYLDKALAFSKECRLVINSAI